VKLLSREECGERLNLIFPAGVVADPRAVAGPLAAAAVYACVYCGAFQGHNPIRPSMVLWMCGGVAQRAAASSPEDFIDDRERWYRAALRGHDALSGLLAEWGIEHRPWYRDNSREPLRDETFREWLGLGAMDHDASVPTTSPRPAWTLKGDFAGLFKPGLEAVDLTDAIAAWQAANLGAVGRTRIRLEGQRRAAEHTVEVRLPNGSVRPLAPGDSSLILKGVIEQLAPRLLGSFGVVAISQSKRKIDVSDDELLRDLGLSVQASELLPDALLFEAAESRFWFVEAVATDGEIHETRRQELLRWAADQGIAAEHCAFLTGFLSRTHDAFRRRASRLAWRSYAWFFDEPDKVLKLEDLAQIDADP
jgi:hypothetical protein